MYHYDTLEYPNVTQVDLRGHWRSLQVNQIEIRPCNGNAPKAIFITSQIYNTDNFLDGYFFDNFVSHLKILERIAK